MMQELINTQDNNLIISKTNINQLAQEFINYLDVKEASFKTYVKGIRVYIQYVIENNLASNRETIINFREYLKETNHKATTIHSYLNAIKKFYSYLSDRLIVRNEFTAIKSPIIEQSFKKDYLTQEQAKELINSIDTTTTKGKRDYAIITILLTCGLRTIELERANVEDLQIKNGNFVLFIQGKGDDDKTKYVKINYQIEKIIRAYLNERNDVKPTSPLFTSDSNNGKDQRLTRDSIGRIVKTQLRKIGLDNPRLTAHSLRHTTATLNLLNGATLEETQQLLRHKNINTTMIYNHALTRENNKSEERLANLLLS